MPLKKIRGTAKRYWKKLSFVRKRRKKMAEIRGGEKFALNRRRWHGYAFTSTPLREIDDNLLIDLEKEIKWKIQERGGRKPRILDLGCGQGTAIQELAEKFGERANYGALDAWKDLDWKHPRVDWRKGNLHQALFFFGKNSTDLAYSHLALESAPRLEEFFSQMHGVLRPGGLFFADVPTSRFHEIEKSLEEFDILRIVDLPKEKSLYNGTTVVLHLRKPEKKRKLPVAGKKSGGG